MNRKVENRKWIRARMKANREARDRAAKEVIKLNKEYMELYDDLTKNL